MVRKLFALVLLAVVGMVPVGCAHHDYDDGYSSRTSRDTDSVGHAMRQALDDDDDHHMLDDDHDRFDRH